MCAICKTHLVIDASAVDSESVVGDECHIISGAENGPRHDSSLSSDAIDNVANLILLCRVHHKLVDDQPETFSSDTLRQLKANHEKWVRDKLNHSLQLEPVRIVRNKNETPTHLFLVTSAKALLELSVGCHCHYDDYPYDLSEAELNCVGAFLQNLKDWVELGISEPCEKISAQKSLAESMSELDQAGLRVYAAREKQQLRGGNAEPSVFYALHLRIVWNNDSSQKPVVSRSNG